MKQSDFNVKQIKHWANSNDKLILSKLGLGDFTEKGIQDCCPIHNGDNPTAFSYDKNLKIWSCFTHQCHENYGSDLIGLVKAIKKCSFYDSLKWILNLSQGKIDQTVTIDPEVENLHLLKRTSKNEIISEDCLGRLEDNHTIPLERGFKLETIKKFEGGLSTKGYGINHRYYIPIRNKYGQLVGFTGRSVYAQCKKCKQYHDTGNCPPKNILPHYAKWKHYPNTFEKNLELYDLHNAKEYIYKTKTAILGEGPFDKWGLYQHGILNSVSSLGISLSNEQIRLLAWAGCINLIILWDGDEQAQKSIDRLIGKIKNGRPNLNNLFRVYIPEREPNKDPASFSDDYYNNYLIPFIKKVEESQI